MATDIRQRALEKIAALSAQNPSTAFDKSDLNRLCRACPTLTRSKENGYSSKPALGRVPMTIREYEVLLALCKAAPLVQTGQSALKLARQLIPYLLESHAQLFSQSPFFRKIEPSPTEALTLHVTAALLSLGANHDGVQEAVSDTIWTFTNACFHATESIMPNRGDDGEGNLDDAIRTATIALSLLGFLDAASAQAEFWKAGGRLSLIRRLRKLLSEPFLIAVETAFSTIRNSHSHDQAAKEWRRRMRQYAEARRPLGAMLLQCSFMRLLVATTSLLVVEVEPLREYHVLDLLMSGEGLLRPMTARSGEADFRSVEEYANVAIEQMNYFEGSADFIQMGSSAQQNIAFGARSAALISYLLCSRLNEDAADVDLLMSWLEESLADLLQMANEQLVSTALRCMALVCRISPSLAANVSRLLPRFIVQSGANERTIEIASKSLAFVLRLLSSDAVITTLYTLGNVLSPGSDHSLANGVNGDGEAAPAMYQGGHSTGSAISLQLTGEEETSAVYGNVVQAICGIAISCNDEKITALAQSMILQKIGKINSTVDAQIVAGAASLSLSGGQLEFRSLLKMYTRICHEAVVEQKDVLLAAVMKARNHISANLRRGSPLYDIYWDHLMDGIVTQGDTKESDVQLAAREIEQLLQPLAVFMSANDLAVDAHMEDEGSAMLRDAWFNIVVHGFSPASDRGKKYLDELRIMAIHSPPLVAEQRGEMVESDIELNPVLRRGMNSERESQQKKHLSELLPSKAAEIRSLSYRKVIFLHAAYLVESLRAESGDCAAALSYFLEPSMRRGDVSSIMEAITGAVVERYLKKTLSGTHPSFTAQYAAKQLVAVFCNCCHRIERVQQAAYSCADRIISQVPSTLCCRSSLFALLELLSLMWSSCLEAETDLYEPRTTFKSARGHVTVELSDDYAFRRKTLDNLYKRAKGWVSTVVSLAPADVKGLLQTYLSDFDDDGAYGHISLGRSFALELGSCIPTTDQRLQSLNRIGDCHINTASDFVAQYTTRQEYRYAETLPDHSLEWLSFMRIDRRSSLLPVSPDGDSSDAVTALAHIEARLNEKKNTPLGDVRDILRRAAALLCRSERPECAVAHCLVSIPFAMFTKQSIKLGVSLWLGVMNENPMLEPRLLNEIAQQWELSLQRRLGLFSPAITNPDPFLLKEEFAPSDAVFMAKRKQLVHNLLSPHTRLLQFLSSHFNATRLGSADTQRVFLRLLDLTLDAITSSTPHPMARDLKFQIILYGLRVLRTSTTLSAIAQWRLKDKLLSAALSWFNGPPSWSFGSNVLQLRTEIRLLSDIMGAVKAVSFIGANAVGSIKSLQAREQLLLLLLESEHTRLRVWVYPLGEPAAAAANAAVNYPYKGGIENAIFPLIRTAWEENPSIAVGLVSRFQNNLRIHKEVRWLLLNFPSKAVSDPEAIAVLLDGGLPVDVTVQLKHLLYWAPVAPITAVTYFLPAFQNHPLIMQYAMRALESHPVDVTFFYVPQIVQTLRHDALGYVERYILETAQFSQLFAHQIIWNMKANAYKDDDSTIPDAIKPTLDKVMTKMNESFSTIDREFYEREFAFFDEVTGISGKLKPLIKRSKEEKKQKIEEELRNIKVEVGVYLPSNPDGVVIGIDRKSGKPLQSHAKAPYMATFRIKRNKTIDATDNLLEESAKPNGSMATENTIEVWQSAIFKVGDDCRQDVLALQMIAAFRGIFHSVGLDVYVFPYRVTATAPGCGVIDVLPNSISRDMLGREAVNGLYEYFTSKYGNEDSLRFQQARNNFVKSMAAYSIISFLLQFKDRHNGNIMVDDAGHILHIDFGFCFDIAPGGIKFERAPFKLTSEMMAVMGGSTDSQAFKSFEELCVKAFLASRQHTEKLSQIVLLMMDSGLPCFKPESVKHFKDRFVLDRTEREAADFVKDLIRKSHGSYSTGFYDSFQLMTNGIPY
ncbi:phosphatidylinositol 4-kinase [Gaeumannomyces tritici R3-111a-1]|uniref:1-phosphatidylinositol 4-kinase n=1 Tax=Gaeumannomyces tritici (strain R3-111a-1) TaxID=644352 RepID=J3P7Z5_GAET3|nr:phosphatidylinositol 4-kinase [Gaeumannomyces tritici R3-111a-1]EJT72778.1 phosphatidylinositol 4-kinase [Gaeumannomyces tritici R3-111a-1]